MPSLAEIILEGGRLKSDAIRQAAQIEATRQAQTGAIWGRTLSDLGNTVAGTVTEMQRLKQNAPLVAAKARSEDAQTQLTGMQLDKMKADAAAQSMQRQSDAITQKFYMQNPDGSWTLDLKGAQKAHEDAGIPFDATHLAPILDSFNKVNSAFHENKKQGINELVNGVHAGGDTLSALQHAGVLAVRNGYLNNDAMASIWTEAQAHPDQIKAQLDRLQGKEPEKPLVVPAGSTVLGGSPSLMGGATFTAPKEPTPTSLQSKDVMVDGKPVVAAFDPHTGKYAVNGQDVTDRVRPIPPASVQVLNAVGSQASATPIDASRPDPTTGNKRDPATGLTPNSTYQGALTFALKGTLPSGSRSAANIPSQRAIQNKAGAIASAAGVDLPTLQQEFAGASDSTKKLTDRYQFLMPSSEAAKENIDYALSLSPNIPRGGAPAANRFSQWFQHELGIGGDVANLSQFELAIYTASREYAKVTTGSAASISELSAAAAAKADQLINAAQTPEQFKKVTDAMRGDMDRITGPLYKQLQDTNSVGPNLRKFLEFTSGKPSTVTKPKTAQELIDQYSKKGG